MIKIILFINRLKKAFTKCCLFKKQIEKLFDLMFLFKQNKLNWFYQQIISAIYLSTGFICSGICFKLVKK